MTMAQVDGASRARDRLFPRRPDRSGMRVYSIGTASRPINRATSSKRSESCSATACASRTRHSSSLSVGILADILLGTIDGTGHTRSVWMSGIESPVTKPRHHQAWGANATFWGSFPARPVGGIARQAARAQFSYRRKGQQILIAQQFASRVEVASEPPISRFASLGGFVIRWPVANLIGFACSSVAQR